MINQNLKGVLPQHCIDQVTKLVNLSTDSSINFLECDVVLLDLLTNTKDDVELYRQFSLHYMPIILKAVMVKSTCIVLKNSVISNTIVDLFKSENYNIIDYPTYSLCVSYTCKSFSGAAPYLDLLCA